MSYKRWAAFRTARAGWGTRFVGGTDDKVSGHSDYDRAVIAGYRHPGYAAALSEFGSPVRLECSGGSLLVRTIPRTSDRDAMGPYPLFACERWSRLAADLEGLAGKLVSVSLVTDPFGNWTVEELDRAFPDCRRPFKEHFVVELAADPLKRVSAHHQRFATRGQRKVIVEHMAAPADLLDDWTTLYGQLVRRHQITGVAAFSRASFTRQLAVPGLIAFRACEAGNTVGAGLWYVDGDVAYWHLAAYSARGYKLDASYALLAAALEHFAGAGLTWASLGAGAGLQGDPSDGLSRFKAGWATDTRTAHLCGRILDHDRYGALNGAPTAFFPAYRAGNMPAL